MRRYLPLIVALALVLILIDVRALIAPVPPSTPPPIAADGGHVLTAPPPALVPHATVAHANSFHFVAPVYARDLPAYNLSKPINAAAHRWRISPVGLLAIIWSECSLYTHGKPCDHYGPWEDWSHGSCQVIVATAAYYGIGNGTEAADGAVKQYEDNPRNCIFLAAHALADMKRGSGQSFPNLAIVWNCGSMAAYIYGSLCYSNHTVFLNYWAMAAAKGTDRPPGTR